ncbi:MAG: lipoyl(octanoyl) transferase LipB [Aphanocapsa lilacina HA4352-LM1]|jgi:lipoyl(octanoyl) transferase|nr:lipoyl(octanoyl) transferase LipB [Aphanocapsa lilacina HA4352-LM1]
MGRCLLIEPGLVAYPTAWEWQRQLVAARIAHRDRPDVLMLLEHPPVYTLGQGADARHVLVDPASIELYRTERGGEVTYHGPGQLVGYPILDLSGHRRDLHWYLRTLEQVLIEALADFGVQGTREPGLTGVWVGGQKIAALGIKVSRWVTMHGFALNVDPDLDAFARIVPCGLTRPVGSLAQLCPQVSVEQVQPVVACAFARLFGVQCEPGVLEACLAVRPGC